jgi:RNA polymerase sigma factor (sigma-70 family)
MDLERLLHAARRGDRWAGPALVTLLMPMLMQYAREIGQDLAPSHQEQSVERAVLRAVERLDRYAPEISSFPSWVRGFLRHAIADVRRSQLGYAEQLVNEVPDFRTSGEVWPADDDSNSTDNLVWSLLELSVGDQIMIALRDFEGLTYIQCAERIGGGVTAGACRVRHFRALRRLKELLRADSKYDDLFEVIAGEEQDDGR